MSKKVRTNSQIFIRINYSLSSTFSCPNTYPLKFHENSSVTCEVILPTDKQKHEMHNLLSIDNYSSTLSWPYHRNEL